MLYAVRILLDLLIISTRQRKFLISEILFYFYLGDETLDVPGLGSLAALDEVVRGAVADDQEQETAGVFVFVLTGELLLQIVHLFAV